MGYACELAFLFDNVVYLNRYKTLQNFTKSRMKICHGEPCRTMIVELPAMPKIAFENALNHPDDSIDCWKFIATRLQTVSYFKGILVCWRFTTSKR